MKNRIYFFTGTGNSLNAAQNIAKALPNCELVAICKDTPLEVPANFERIGFVFPTYAGGPPKMVANFILNMNLPNQNSTYLFAVTTYGGNAINAGSAISKIREDLKQRNWQLHYGTKLLSYPNAVTLYPMIKGVGLFTRIAERSTRRIVKKIVNKQQISIPFLKESAKKRYENYMAQISNSDSSYHVNDDCVSCGICKKVCPAKNITIDDGKPVFHHQCESCMACIQHCPKRAINYQDKTQKRGRYTHPDVNYQTIIQYYGR